MISLCGFFGAALALVDERSTVRIMSPEQCTRVQQTDRVHLEFESDAVDDGVFEIALTDSAGAWTFDIPPTPWSSNTLLYFCNGRLVQDRAFCAFSDCDVKPRRLARVAVDLALPKPDHQYDVRVRLLHHDGTASLAPTAHVLVSNALVFPPSRLAEQAAGKQAALQQYWQEGEARMRRNAARFALAAPFALERAVAPGLLEALDSGNRTRILSLLRLESSSGIWSIDLFTPEFCAQLLGEIVRFRDTAGAGEQPNSMNRLGVVLDEMNSDVRTFFDELTARIAQPLASVLFEEWLNGGVLDHHHAFSVQYVANHTHADGVDHLSTHMDDSTITINACLGRDFTGGAVFFRGVRDSAASASEQFDFQHRVGGGNAIIHVGQHWHGAKALTSGERHNVIVWARATAAKASPTERFAQSCEA